MRFRLKYFLVAILTVLILLIFSGVHFDIPREELRKYATEKSQFITLDDGSRVHYRDEGKKNKPVIILLHGFNGSLFNFETMVPFLISDFRLISIDLPGFGLTDQSLQTIIQQKIQ